MNRYGKTILALVIVFCMSLPCVMSFNYRDAVTDISREKYISDISSIYREYNGDLSKKDKDDPLALNRLVVYGYNGKLYGSCARAWDKKHKTGILQYKTRSDAKEAMDTIRSEGYTVEGDSVAEIVTDGESYSFTDSENGFEPSLSKGTFSPDASEYLGTADYINKIAMNTDDVIVATVDTGVMYDHTAIADRFYSHGIDVSGDGCEDAYYDTELEGKYYGHATMVAGIIADNTPDNVKILPYKAVPFGSDYAPASSILNGINYAVDDGADVINVSIATNGCELGIANAVATARSRGICVCSSAGNSGAEVTERFPSATPWAITVSFLNAEYTIDSASNYGSCIDFCAPGRRITSTFPVNGTSGFSTSSGTSFSTPYISACCACIKSVKKDLSRDGVYDTLCDFARDLGDEGKDIYYGNGAPYLGNMIYTDGETYRYRIPEGDLDIYSSVDYTDDTQPWKRFADRLVEVNVDNSIARIGNYSFKGMASAEFNMREVYDKIGSYAFSGCAKLTSYTCSIDVEEIGTGAFSNIDNFVLSGYRNTPSETYAIRENVNFNIIGCKHDYKHVVYEPTKERDGYTLYTCTVCGDSYEGAYIEPIPVDSGSCGENLTYTFYDTGRLMLSGSGDMYDYMNTPAPWADYSDEIIVLQLKEDVGEISPYAFYGCSSLTKFFISEDNAVYYDYENELVRRDDNSLALVIARDTFNVPDYVSSIDARAFIFSSARFVEGGGYHTEGRLVYDEDGNIVMAFSDWEEETFSPEENTVINDYAFILTPYPTSVACDMLSVDAGEYSIGYYFNGTMQKRNLVFTICSDSLLYTYAVNNGFTVDLGNSGKCGDNIVWRYDENTTKLTLTGRGDMYSYNSVEDIPWYAYMSQFTEVVISDKITSLSDYSFYKTARMYYLTMPLSLEAPENSTVWDGCTVLRRINLTLGTGIMDDYIKNGVNLYEYTPWYIGRYSITSFNLDPDVKYISTYAFFNCLAIKTLTFNCIEEIEEYAFVACTNLTEITNYCKTTVYGDYSIFSYRFGTTSGYYANRKLRAYSDSTSKDLADTTDKITLESLGCGHSRNTEFVRDEQIDEFITHTIYSCADCNEEFIYAETDAGKGVNLTVCTKKELPVSGAEVYLDGELFGTADENGIIEGKALPGEYALELKMNGFSVFTSEFTVGDEDVSAQLKFRYLNYVDDGAVNAKDFVYAKNHGFNDKNLFDYGKISADDNRIIYED